MIDDHRTPGGDRFLDRCAAGFANQNVIFAKQPRHFLSPSKQMDFLIADGILNRTTKFFVATDELESKELKFLGWKGPKTGERLIEKAAKHFKKSNGKD